MEPSPPLPKSAVRAVIAYLNEQFTEYGIHASTKVPTPRPPKLFRCTLAGLTFAPQDEEDYAAHTDTLVNVEYWENDPDTAEQIGRLVFAKLADLDNDDFWFIGYAGGLAYDEDAVTSSPRYIMTPIIRSRLEGC